MILVLSLKLLLAHILGDFVFQPKKWVKHKMAHTYKSPYLYYHIVIHLILLLALFKFNFAYWPIFVTIGLTHYTIDLTKLRLTKPNNERVLFFLDQLAHLLILALLVYAYNFDKINLLQLPTSDLLLFATCIVFVSFVSSIILQQVLAPWDTIIKKNLNEGNNQSTSISGAGKIIGILERLFVFGFILLNAWSAIGFLIAAKSVFRFGDLSEGKNRQLTEYVLIGTLISFGLAILTGLSFNFLKSML